jgi:hypothetical protein
MRSERRRKRSILVDTSREKLPPPGNLGNESWRAYERAMQVGTRT